MTAEVSIAPPTESTVATGSVAEHYASVRALTETLARPCSAEDQTIQSMPDVSPTKWHRAHVTWFFETFVLRPNDPSYTPFDASYEYLFNSYYETVGPRHPRAQRGLLSRPSVADVGRYRRHVDAAMQRFFERGPLDDDITALIELGLHHEQQHQELLLMDIKHVLSVNPLLPAYRDDLTVAAAAPNPPLRFVEHEGGLVEIGHAGTPDAGFAFDNETPRHTTYLQPFAIAERAVTCGDWLDFMADDGYGRADLWLSEGLASVQAYGWRTPDYWHRDGDGWQVFTLAGPKPLDPAEPVCHISYFEADAFARWSGARLASEAEWEAVAAAQPVTGNFLDLEVLHPRPSSPSSPSSAPSASSLFGDVWQWTASAYLPYPGFRPAPGAVGEYNGKFMVNQHVLRGGCCATPPGHTRATYRNFFPASARWPFAGARLARDL